MSLSLAILGSLVAAVVPVKAERPADKHNCTHSHTRQESLRGVRANMRHPWLTRARGARSWHFVRCTRTARSERLVRGELIRLRAWRRSYTGRWLLAWKRLPLGAQGWTRSVSWKESKHCADPATNTGLYRGCFQWVLATWHSACGCSIHPTRASWHHEAVVAWHWHLSHPTGQWPNTGE